MTILQLFSFFSFFLSIFGYQPDNQLNDPKAKTLLDAVSKTYKGFASISATFSIATYSPTQNKTTTKMGKQEIFCDKQSVWTYLKDINEVQINDYEANKEDITPSNMFTIYQNNFNYIMNGEEEVGKNNCAIVDLMPKDKSKPFFKLRIWVDKGNKYIKRMKVFDKNGNLYTYSVNSFDTKSTIEDSFFKFETAKHPGVHVEDLRM